MLISPLILFTFLLLGLALSYFIAARWPHAVYHMVTAVVGLGLVLWLILGRQLPHIASLGNASLNSNAPSWQWHGDETIWVLSGVLLLLVFSLLLYRAGRINQSPNRSKRFNWQLQRSELQPVLILAIVVAGLVVIWAATLAAFMTFWTLFVILWALYLLTTGANSTSVTKKMYWMLLPLFFSGLAAAVKPVGSNLLDLSGWSQAAILALVLTTMAQMGIMPFIGWHPRSNEWQPADGPILFLLPSLVGAGLLARLVATAYIEPVAILIITVFALITVLSGVRRSFAELRSATKLPANLALALNGLAFLAAIWTGSTPFLAAVQLLVFASTTLFFLENLSISRDRWWRAIGPALALLALAAFPLTAGFITLSSIYTIWFSNGFLVMALVLVLLMLPLVTAVLIFVRDHIDSPSTTGRQHLSPVAEIAQLLPATGLVMLGGLALSEIQWATWLALLVTAAGALLLTRYVGEAQEAITTFDAALSTDTLPFAHSGPTIKKFARQLIFSLGEAAFILEGDRGLLWLAAFLAVILLAVSS